jgi:hypothetical protein
MDWFIIRKLILLQCDLQSLKKFYFLDKLSFKILNDKNFWIDKFTIDDLQISSDAGLSELIEEYTKITQSKIDARKIILLNNIENRSQKDLGNIIIEIFCLQHTLKIVSLLTKYDDLKTKIILQNNTKPIFLVVFKPLKNGVYKSTCYFTNYDGEHSSSTNNEINYKELHIIITFALYNNLIIVDNNNNKFINSTNICKEQIDYRSIA